MMPQPRPAAAGRLIAQDRKYGHPRLPRGCPQQKPRPLTRTEISTATIVFYLRKDIRQVTARDRLITAAAEAVTPAGSVLFSGRQRPDEPGKTGNIVIVASATASEPAPVLAVPGRAMPRNASPSSTRAVGSSETPAQASRGWCPSLRSGRMARSTTTRPSPSLHDPTRNFHVY